MSFGRWAHTFRYGFAQPTAGPSHPLPTAGYAPLDTAGQDGQGLSIHWAHGYPSRWAHGGDAYGYWQAQQQQYQYQHQQPAPPQQMPSHFTWPGFYNHWTGQQQYSRYNQHPDSAHKSYLSPGGVPFDLQQPNHKAQLAQHLGLNNDEGKIYKESPPIRYTTVLHACRSLVKDSPSLPRRALHGRQNAATELPSISRPHYNGNTTTTDERHLNALVRCSPKLNTPHARSYRGRPEHECLQWDEQHGFGFIVPRPEVKLTHRSHSLPTRRGGRTSERSEQCQSNTTTVSVDEAHLGDEQQDEENEFGLSPTNLSRTRSHHGFGGRNEQTALQDFEPASEKYSSQPCSPNFCPVLSRRTCRSRVIKPSASGIPVQLLEHSIGTDGTLQTTAQELCSKTTITVSQRRGSHRASGNRSHEWMEDLQALYKQHVPVSYLKELANGMLIPENKQRSLVVARSQETGNPTSHIGRATNLRGEEDWLLGNPSCIERLSSQMLESTDLAKQNKM